MFKILNGYENIDSNIFFEIKESKITRGHNFTLVKKLSRLDIRKFSFSQRTINVWNKLSAECVMLVVLMCSRIQFNSIQNNLFSTQHIVHTTMFFCIRRVEKGTSRRQRLCGLVP